MAEGLNEVQVTAIAQSTFISGKQQIVKDLESKIFNSVNTIATGVGNAAPTDTPTANISTYNASVAGTYTNFGGVVISTADLAAGEVQLRKNTVTGVWEKFVLPISNLAGYVNKASDITKVTIPASKNLFDKDSIPTGNLNMILPTGLGSLQSSTTSHTSDYLNISSFPVGTVFQFKSGATGKGAARMATYTEGRTYRANSNDGTEKSSFTKTTDGQYWIRLSINYDAIPDFQVEVGEAPTAYQAFSPGRTYFSAIDGSPIITMTEGNIDLFIPTIAANTPLPKPISGKLMRILPGTYLQPNATTLVIAKESIVSFDGSIWTPYVSLQEPLDIVTTTLAPSKNIFDKATMLPEENKSKSVNLNLGSLQNSSTSDTTDYIDISSYPIGTVFAMKSQSTGRGATRMAKYTQGKNYVNGSSTEGPHFSFTRTTDSQYWVRVSIPFSAQADFQIEVDLGNGSTDYVPYSLGGKILNSINGAVVNASSIPSTPTTPTPTEPVDVKVVHSTNLLDPSKASTNKQINITTGAVESGSGSVSALMPIKANTPYAVWCYTTQQRTVVWYDIDKNYISHNAFATKKANWVSPINAAYAQVDYMVSGTDPKRMVFNQGKDSTVWMPYNERSTTNNIAVGRTLGKILWVFGASVSAARSDLYEPTWLNKMAKLGFAEVQCFAVSGATMRGTGTNTSGAQIQQAIDEGHAAPDFILFDFGTNDGLDNLGSVTTAIQKVTYVDDLTDLNVLDRTKTAEAFVHGIYKLKFLFPNAKIFTTTFFKKARPVELAGWKGLPIVEVLRGVAEYTSVHVIDQFKGLGVLPIFEVSGSGGRHTTDGQHLNDAGQSLAANFIAGEFFKNTL